MSEHKTDGVMEKLYNTLQAMGEKDAANKILDDALAANPDNFVALADKGLGLLQTNPAEAAKCLKRAAELKADNAVIQTYAGTALSVQAQEIEDAAKKKALYEEAIKYYDKAKELDPDRLQSNCRATGVTTATTLTTTSTVLTILRPSRQRPTASNPTD